MSSGWVVLLYTVFRNPGCLCLAGPALKGVSLHTLHILGCVRSKQAQALLFTFIGRSSMQILDLKGHTLPTESPLVMTLSYLLI